MNAQYALTLNIKNHYTQRDNSPFHGYCCIRITTPDTILKHRKNTIDKVIVGSPNSKQYGSLGLFYGTGWGITLFRIPQFYWLTILNPAGVALREYFLRLFHHDNFIISIHFIIFLESMLPFLFSMKLSHFYSDIIKASSFWTIRIYLLLRPKVNIRAIKRRNKINILFISHFWFQTEIFS